MNPCCPADNTVQPPEPRWGEEHNKFLCLSTTKFAHRCAFIAVLSVSSRLASHLPRHGSKVHVCERDSERSLHSLGLHVLHHSRCAVNGVYPPGI